MKPVIRLLLGLLVLSGLFMAPVSAAPLPAEFFTITDYDVNAIVSEHNVYNITETIKVHFTEPRRGIYRKIPYRGTLKRDGSNGERYETRYKYSISDIQVEGFEYDTSRSDGNVVIKIGNADSYVDGDQVYRISYKLNMGGDGMPDFDEAYFNIIGAGWDTTIDHVSFSVQLPKEFDASLLGFSMGGANAKGYLPDDLKFEVSGSTITGETRRMMFSREALTMRLELPQGYYDVFELDPRIPEWLLMVLFTLMVIGAVVLFFIYGRDAKPLKTVEFYPPDGLTPAEIGYINDGCVDNRDVVSLVMYWADRGYLQIEDNGSGEFTLIKLRDIDAGAKAFEAHMFQKLFKSGNTVTTSDLKYSFYKTVASTKAMVSDSFERKERRVFTKASMTLKPWLSFATALPAMITLAYTMYRDTQDFISTAFITVIIGLIILFPVYFLISTLRRWRADRPAIRIIKLLSFLFLCLLALVFFLILTVPNALLSGLPWIAALATAFIGLVAVFISKRTPKGVEWQGRIMGFAEFIELAERDKLVALVEQNPAYFYNILPYAYVLNISDKWAKNFEAIALEPPGWYTGYGDSFTPILFVNSLSHSMNNVQSMMVSTPSSSGGGSGGGGGFSGGGFSGGGGGGGGGGSW